MEPSVLHRRLAALVCGIVVAALVVAATCLALPAQDAGAKGAEYGYVYSGAKSSSVPFIRSAMDENTLLVLGSSEFSTPSRLVPQVPSGTFGGNNYGIRLMCVGEAFDQALWHAMALGAIADGGLPRSKVALIVGLGQYVDGGMDASTFNERFSFSLYKGFTENDAIPEGVKRYVRGRLREQGTDEVTVRAGAPANPIDAINGAVMMWMDDLRLRYRLIEVRHKGQALCQGETSAPDWDHLMDEAMASARQMSTNNDLGVEDDFYANQLAAALEAPSGSRSDETYQDTSEYGDLKCFLDVCDFCGVEPLIIIEPVLGPYYDHIGIDQTLDIRQFRPKGFGDIQFRRCFHRREELREHFSAHERHEAFELVYRRNIGHSTLRYLSPVSGRSTTIFLFLYSGRAVNCNAAA